jgi:hypothetical protein
MRQEPAVHCDRRPPPLLRLENVRSGRTPAFRLERRRRYFALLWHEDGQGVDCVLRLYLHPADNSRAGRLVHDSERWRGDEPLPPPPSHPASQDIQITDRGKFPTGDHYLRIETSCTWTLEIHRNSRWQY